MRNLNKEVLYRIAILITFSIFFLSTSVTGKAKLFVHPKLIPLVFICGVLFIVISFIMFPLLFKDVRKSKLRVSMLIFIPPLLMAFIIPAKPITNNFVPYEAPNSVSQNNSADSGYVTDNSIQDSDISQSDLEIQQDTAVQDSNDNKSENDALGLTNGKIIMDDNNFIRWMEEIYTNLPKYDGKEIELTGFVYLDKAFKSNEFVAARALMACCAADTQVIGFLCKYKGADSLKKDSWFKFTGKIKKETYEGKPSPTIEISNMQSISKPKNEYIYPY